MKKVVWKFLIMAILGTAMVACSSDKSYPPYSKDYIIGSYEGECNVSFGSTKIIIQNYPAKFTYNNRNTDWLALDLGDEAFLDSIGLGQISAIDAHNFKNKVDYADFLMSDIKVSYSGLKIPSFFYKYTTLQADEHNTATMSLSLEGIPVKYNYNLNPKEVSFSYKGEFTIKTQDGSSSTIKNVVYEFNLLSQ